jgi:hypothetical protein
MGTSLCSEIGLTDVIRGLLNDEVVYLENCDKDDSKELFESSDEFPYRYKEFPVVDDRSSGSVTPLSYIDEDENPINSFIDSYAFPTISAGRMFDPKITLCNKTSSCECFKCQANKDSIWMCDSGASHHFTFCKNDFVDYEEYVTPSQKGL